MNYEFQKKNAWFETNIYAERNEKYEFTFFRKCRVSKLNNSLKFELDFWFGGSRSILNLHICSDMLDWYWVDMIIILRQP